MPFFGAQFLAEVFKPLVDRKIKLEWGLQKKLAGLNRKRRMPMPLNPRVRFREPIYNKKPQGRDSPRLLVTVLWSSLRSSRPRLRCLRRSLVRGR